MWSAMSISRKCSGRPASALNRTPSSAACQPSSCIAAASRVVLGQARGTEAFIAPAFAEFAREPSVLVLVDQEQRAVARGDDHGMSSRQWVNGLIGAAGASRAPVSPGRPPAARGSKRIAQSPPTAPRSAARCNRPRAADVGQLEMHRVRGLPAQVRGRCVSFPPHRPTGAARASPSPTSAVPAM